VSTFPILKQHNAGIPSQVIRQEKEIQIIQIEKEDIKVSLFAGDMVLYLKDPKNFTQKLLGLINTLRKVARY
jgi:hypothetical protein